MPAQTRTRRPGTKRPNRWERLDDARLLEMRFCDLGLGLADSVVEPDVERLHRELERRGIRFRPHLWLSEDWFSPDGVPGIAVPFFAAHPRLRQLERTVMGDVDGGNKDWRLRILRHETGHAIDTAYRLRRRADWRHLFGYASKRYPGKYTSRPRSRRHVLHLANWYAQSHPTEDFAETFAVWMQPRARWRRDYAGWPAMTKLAYLDRVIEEIGPAVAPVRNRIVIEPLSTNRRTLADYYRRKRTRYGRHDRRYDGWLQRAFVHRDKAPDALPAGQFLREIEPQLRHALARDDLHRYLVSHVVEFLAYRARQLNLVVTGGRRENVRRLVMLHQRVALDVLQRNRQHYIV